MTADHPETHEPTNPPAPAPDVTPEIEPPAATDPDYDAPSAEFAQALADFEKRQGGATEAAAAPELAVGQAVKGRVVSIGDEQVLIDFGGRSEGVAEIRLFKNEDGTLRVAVGDVLDLFVTQAGDPPTLSTSLGSDRKAASREAAKAALARLRDAQQSGAPVSGKVTGTNAGGLTVDLGGVRGFCPVSQIEDGFVADTQAYVGRVLEFVVTKVEDGRKGAVVSRRQLLRKANEAAGKALLASLAVGDEREGRVRKLEAFGAFVDLGGIDGLVHVSEIRHERTNHPKEALKEGDTVHVKVLRLETDKSGRPKIALSIKAVTPDPWLGVTEQLQPGMRVQGTVARLQDFGAFVTLAPGVDGLVHVSEIASHRIGHPKEVLKPGQAVEAVVKSIDVAKKRIALSIREALEAGLPPAREAKVGDVVEGRIGNLKEFGVFVDLPVFGGRTSGLLPRENTGPRDPNWADRFKVGEALEVEVIEIRDGKLRLGLPGVERVARPARPERSEGERPARPERPRRESGGREGGGRPGGAREGTGRSGGDRAARGPRDARRPREGRPSREERSFTMPAPRSTSDEPTTMAIALRKAIEEAKRREAGG